MKLVTLNISGIELDRKEEFVLSIRDQSGIERRWITTIKTFDINVENLPDGESGTLTIEAKIREKK